MDWLQLQDSPLARKLLGVIFTFKCYWPNLSQRLILQFILKFDSRCSDVVYTGMIEDIFGISLSKVQKQENVNQ